LETPGVPRARRIETNATDCRYKDYDSNPAKTNSKNPKGCVFLFPLARHMCVHTHTS